MIFRTVRAMIQILLFFASALTEKFCETVMIFRTVRTDIQILLFFASALTEKYCETVMIFRTVRTNTDIAFFASALTEKYCETVMKLDELLLQFRVLTDKNNTVIRFQVSCCTDKKENQIFLIHIRKFRVEQLQSHI